ncbi:MAG: type IV pilin [Methanosarcinales archaeon]
MTQKANIRLRHDTRGVSPVIGVIMMIAVVALIAAFVAAVA